MMTDQLRNDLFYKSFMVAGMQGAYLEFGVYRGKSMIRAYKCAELIVKEFLGGQWSAGDNPQTGAEHTHAWISALWDQLRFVAFDSFEGIPATENPVDAFYNVFPAGSYSCSMRDFAKNLQDAGVDLRKVAVVPGFFEKTLSAQTAQDLKLREIAVVHIDADLYESAKLALDFCTPYFRDGSIVVFDEWFQFRGNPKLGERRAFTEWQQANPDWIVSDYHTQGPWTKAFILNRDPNV